MSTVNNRVIASSISGCDTVDTARTRSIWGSVLRTLPVHSSAVSSAGCEFCDLLAEFILSNNLSILGVKVLRGAFVRGFDMFVHRYPQNIGTFCSQIR